jgi:redox-sensitive bicupin YhaK (pirin superfamily)
MLRAMSTLPTNDPACVDPACVDPAGDPAVDLVIAGRPRGVGSLPVARLLPAAKRHMVGPFIFLDHMGPVVLDPGVGFDVRPHPHIGLSTVTYLFAGENVHRDSLGTVQVNRPGDLNLMTAGRGIVHSERADDGFRASGGAMHGVQIWLALPDAHEDDEPSFAHHPRATLPVIAPAPGVSGRVLFGAAFGARSPIHHPSEPVLVDLELEAGATVELPADVTERAVFVISGELAITSSQAVRTTAGGARNADERYADDRHADDRHADDRYAERLNRDELAVLRAGRPAVLVARDATRALVLGGAPLGPRLIEWNFVASSRERLDRARDAWKAQRFPKIPGDDKEFIPWPEDHR